jgi:hypothetical protein
MNVVGVIPQKRTVFIIVPYFATFAANWRAISSVRTSFYKPCFVCFVLLTSGAQSLPYGLRRITVEASNDGSTLPKPEYQITSTKDT